MALHCQDALRPSLLQLVQRAKQLVGVRRRPEEPLLAFLLLDRNVLVSPAAAVDDLLVREHGGATRAPVDHRALPVRQALLPHLEEEPLVPAVVLWLAARHLAVPVVAETECLELPLHGLDVGPRPVPRIALVLDRGVLGGQPERVPAHRMQDAEALHALVARQRVTDAVVSDMAHVEDARWVGKHLQHVVLGLFEVGLGGVEVSLRPVRLPFRLDLRRPIRVPHHLFRVPIPE